METAIERIYRQWHDFARSRDVEGLLSLYDNDAVLESPLVPAILDRPNGALRGRAEIRHFLEQGARSKPLELVRWYRSGKYFSDGRTLIWEYPRETPQGDQVEILEVMEIENDHIKSHRIY
jgi:hypothetical protein